MKATPSAPAPYKRFLFVLVLAEGPVVVSEDSFGSPSTVNLIVAPAGTFNNVYTWKLKFSMGCMPSSVSAVLSAVTPSGRNTVRLLTGSTKGCAISNFSCLGTVVNEINPYEFSLGGTANPLSVLT